MSAPCPRFGFIVTLAPEEPRIVEDFQRLLSGYGLDATRAGALAFVITREGSQATNNDREIVRNWSNRWSNVASITVGDLVDLDQEAWFSLGSVAPPTTPTNGTVDDTDDR